MLYETSMAALLKKLKKAKAHFKNLGLKRTPWVEPWVELWPKVPEESGGRLLGRRVSHRVLNSLLSWLQWQGVPLFK